MNIYSIKETLSQAKPKSIHHLNRYIKLIEHASANPSKDSAIELHHILPRSMFPKYEKSKWNLIPLSRKQHFLAHRLLWRAFRNQSMTYAFWLMSNTKEGVIKTSKEYSMLKEENQKYLSEINSGENNPMYGKEPWNKGKSYEIEGRKERWKEDEEFFKKMYEAQHSEESRKKRSQKMAGRVKDEHHKEKIRQANRKTRYLLHKECGGMIVTDSLAKMRKIGYANLSYVFNGKRTHSLDIVKVEIIEQDVFELHIKNGVEYV